MYTYLCYNPRGYGGFDEISNTASLQGANVVKSPLVNNSHYSRHSSHPTIGGHHVMVKPMDAPQANVIRLKVLEKREKVDTLIEKLSYFIPHADYPTVLRLLHIVYRNRHKSSIRRAFCYSQARRYSENNA